MSTISLSTGFEQPISGPIWRLSVDRYHAMIASGNLTEDDRVELLDGVLVEKMTKDPPHTVATHLLDSILSACVPSKWIVRTQEPVTLSRSEPEPDISIVRGTVRDFALRHPLPHEVGLVAEVADTTLTRDRTTKYRIYAEAKVPVYWIVNLIDRQIEVHEGPSMIDGKAEYQSHRLAREAETIEVVIDGQLIHRFNVSDCLP